MLNKRTEVISKCRHENKFYLANFTSHQQQPYRIFISRVDKIIRETENRCILFDSFTLLSSVYLRVIFNPFCTLLDSVYLRVIFDVSYTLLSSVCLRVIFNPFDTLLGSVYLGVCFNLLYTLFDSVQLKIYFQSLI